MNIDASFLFFVRIFDQEEIIKVLYEFVKPSCLHMSEDGNKLIGGASNVQVNKITILAEEKVEPLWLIRSCFMKNKQVGTFILKLRKKNQHK